jgi:hypothetical protein
MLNLKCDKCGRELSEPGALLFSPPRGDGWLVEKYHLCYTCWLATAAQFRPATQPHRDEQQHPPSTRSHTAEISQQRHPIPLWLTVITGLVSALVVAGLILGSLVYWDSMARY